MNKTAPTTAPKAPQPEQGTPAQAPAPQTPSHGGRYKRAEDGTLTPVEE